MALANFDDLLKAVSKDPAMMVYLDTETNRKGKPNENYARELMELFTTGIGHYTEDDVRESARSFTGWTLQGGKQLRYTTASQLVPRLHDAGLKTFMGKTGTFSGDDIVEMLVPLRATAVRLSTRLFSFFAYPNPDQEIVNHLADTFQKAHYNVGAVVRQIFTMDAFYSDQAYRALVKSPAELVAQTLKATGANARGYTAAAAAMAPMGQVLFYPPNVAGWPGGSSWINSSTLLNRINFANAAAQRPRAGTGPAGRWQRRAEHGHPIPGRRLSRCASDVAPGPGRAGTQRPARVAFEFEGSESQLGRRPARHRAGSRLPKPEPLAFRFDVDLGNGQRSGWDRRWLAGPLLELSRSGGRDAEPRARGRQCWLAGSAGIAIEDSRDRAPIAANLPAAAGERARDPGGRGKPTDEVLRRVQRRWAGAVWRPVRHHVAGGAASIARAAGHRCDLPGQGDLSGQQPDRQLAETGRGDDRLRPRCPGGARHAGWIRQPLAGEAGPRQAVARSRPGTVGVHAGHAGPRSRRPSAGHDLVRVRPAGQGERQRRHRPRDRGTDVPAGGAGEGRALRAAAKPDRPGQRQPEVRHRLPVGLRVGAAGVSQGAGFGPFGRQLRDPAAAEGLATN